MSESAALVGAGGQLGDQPPHEGEHEILTHRGAPGDRPRMSGVGRGH